MSLAPLVAALALLAAPALQTAAAAEARVARVPDPRLSLATVSPSGRGLQQIFSPGGIFGPDEGAPLAIPQLTASLPIGAPVRCLPLTCSIAHHAESHAALRALRSDTISPGL